MTADAATPAPQEIDSLIERCLKADQTAWETIVRLYWRKVFNIAYKFVGRHDEAEDLTQDVFLKLFKSLKTFDRRANFSTWLISISRNLCIDHYRSVRREHDAVTHDIDVVTLAQPSTIDSPREIPNSSGSRAKARSRPAPRAARTASSPIGWPVPPLHSRAVTPSKPVLRASSPTRSPAMTSSPRSPSTWLSTVSAAGTPSRPIGVFAI